MLSEPWKIANNRQFCYQSGETLQNLVTLVARKGEKMKSQQTDGLLAVWPDGYIYYSYNIWLFTNMNFCLIVDKVGSEFCQIIN